MTLTNSELAIISLVAERPRYGYEIEQVIGSRGMREWTEIGFSSIYYLLKKLEGHGWISSRLERGEGPGPVRKVYSITPAGVEAFTQASKAALSDPSACYSAFMLGLANLPSLTHAETLQGLRQYLAGLNARQEHIKNRMEAQQPLPEHVEIMFDYSLALLGAETNWVTSLIRRLEA
jgi:DNA-binding PadR family transcriptional regulator